MTRFHSQLSLSVEWAWSHICGLNTWPADYKSAALPVVLMWQVRYAPFSTPLCVRFMSHIKLFWACDQLALALSADYQAALELPVCSRPPTESPFTLLLSVSFRNSLKNFTLGLVAHPRIELGLPIVSRSFYHWTSGLCCPSIPGCQPTVKLDFYGGQ